VCPNDDRLKGWYIVQKTSVQYTNP
jgi:hypothetical protein